MLSSKDETLQLKHNIQNAIFRRRNISIMTYNMLSSEDETRKLKHSIHIAIFRRRNFGKTVR